MTAGVKGPAPSRRSRKRFPVRFGPARPEHIGYSGNVSASGMMIRTTRVFVPGTRLHLEVDLGPRQIRLLGTVVWARAGDVRWLSVGRVGMGLKFVNPPENLMDMVFPIALPG